MTKPEYRINDETRMTNDKERCAHGSSFGLRHSSLIGFSGFAILILVGLLTQQSHAQLRTLDSRHYRIHTDLGTELAEELARRMDALHDEYSRRLVDFTPASAPPRFEVYIFERRNEYDELTGGNFPNTGGVFMPTRNVLAAFLEGQGRDGLRRTLQHEAFHQFAHTAISPKMPIWLNEGLAQLFEEGIYTGDRFIIEIVPPRRVRQLHALMDAQRLIPFELFIETTQKQWADRRHDLALNEAQYLQAWGMVHFLVFASDDSGTPRYRQRFLEMLRHIHAGRDGREAFAAAFSTNYAGFQSRFVEWARALEPSPLAQYMEHQDVLADLLVELHRRGHQFSTIADFRAHLTDSQYPRLRYTKGDLQWLTHQDPLVYFCDLQGNPFTREQLRFEHSPGALMDLICDPLPNVRLRTRFHNTPDKMEHELILESAR
jgi:predicted secreted protein